MVFRVPGDVTAPGPRAQISAVLDQIAAVPGVASVQRPFGPEAAARIGRDGHIALATVNFDGSFGEVDADVVQEVLDIGKGARSADLEVEFGGRAVASVTQQFGGSASEVIGLLAAAVILLFAFGSVIAMGLPLVTALFGVGISFSVVAMLSHLLVVPTFAPELAAMIGIGVGIDYALFIVTRYRQALTEGLEPAEATSRALDTSGRAVLFAGTTVVVSLLGLMLLGTSFVYGLAFGAIAAVMLVMAASTSLLPALLGFSGRAIDRLQVPWSSPEKTAGGGGRFWSKWSKIVQRRPWLTGSVALVVLVVLALPLFSMQLLFADAGTTPGDVTTRRAYDLVSQGFGPGANGPLLVVVETPGGQASALAADVRTALSGGSDVAFVAPPQTNDGGGVAVLSVIPGSAPDSPATVDLVHRIRNDVLPTVVEGSDARALVGGITAAGIDVADSYGQKLYVVIAGVVGLSFLLLMIVFRSIAVPLKAAAMNLLSIGAAYGVIVAVYQWGWGSSLVGAPETGPIDPWIPLFLFTILFGLSMDYEVFLLSRIREEWVATGDNSSAVADGLAHTGRVITAAAAIMFFVFVSFVFQDVRVLKVFGLGLAVAVLVDATIVRMVLVPSTMELLGRANWWFPAWLDRIVPSLRIEGPPDHEDDGEDPERQVTDVRDSRLATGPSR